MLAERSGAEVYLLHVVPKQGEVDEARAKLDLEVARAKQWNAKTSVYKLVRIGSIFDDIGDAAAEISAGLIIMGELLQVGGSTESWLGSNQRPEAPTGRIAVNSV